MACTLRTTAYARLFFLLLLTFLINSTTAATLASISSAASNSHSQSYPDSQPAQSLDDTQFPINFPINTEDRITHHYSSSGNNNNDKKYLHITAVLPHPNTTTNCPSSDLNFSSDLPAVFICLRPPSPFTRYPTLGTSVPLPLPLSKTRNTTLVVLPPGSSEGWHRPPGDGMVFVLLRGTAVVRDYEPWVSSVIAGRGRRCREHHDGDESTSRPSYKHEFTVEPAGPNQFLLALDTTGKGHWTDYPGDEETWALQIPLEEGWEEIVQGWKVVGEGACR